MDSGPQDCGMHAGLWIFLARGQKESCARILCRLTLSGQISRLSGYCLDNSLDTIWNPASSLLDTMWNYMLHRGRDIGTAQ